MKWKTKTSLEHQIFLGSLSGCNWTEATIDDKKHEVRLLSQEYLLQTKNSDVIQNYRIRSIELVQSRHGKYNFKVELNSPGSMQTRSQKISLQLYSPLPENAQNSALSSSALVEAPMNGKVLKVTAKEKTKVTEGQCILIVEAMKMENSVYAPMDGILSEIYVGENDQVSINQKLFKVDKEK